jgi:hypothetical protein
MHRVFIRQKLKTAPQLQGPGEAVEASWKQDKTLYWFGRNIIQPCVRVSIGKLNRTETVPLEQVKNISTELGTRRKILSKSAALTVVIAANHM